MDHLPECPMEIHKGEDLWDDPLFGFPCWCAQLRACEQRLMRDGITKSHGVWHDGYGEGYAAGATAARDAVVAAASTGQGPALPAREWVHTASALAAIDALREQGKRDVPQAAFDALAKPFPHGDALRGNND